MDVAKHLEKAGEAARKKNYDYAVTLYQQVLQLKPDHGDARRELHRTLRKRAEVKRIPRALAAVLGLPQWLLVTLGGAIRRPALVARAADQYLRLDPNSPGMNRALAESLEKCGQPRAAIAVWEALGDHEQLGDHALKRAGALHYALRDMEKALACFEAVLQRSPRDSEAEKMRKNLAAEGVLSSGSYDANRSSRELARDREGQRALEIGQKLVASEDERTLLRRRLEEALAGDPDNKRVRRELVEHHVKGRDYEAACAVLEDVIARAPEAPETVEWRDRLGDVKILGLERQIREARERAAAGDRAAATDLVDLEREKLDFELGELERRVRQHPTDLDLRFRLGRRLLDTGDDERVGDAIESLQRAVKDPRRRVDALLALGEAFERQGLLDLARKQCESALAAVDAASDRAVEITYRLGAVHERAGDEIQARRSFESIYERDIHYKDVAERLERLRSRAAKPRAEATRPEPEASGSEAAPAARPPPRDERSGGDGGDGPAIYGFQD